MRYWDGTSWTDHFSPTQVTPQTSSYPVPMQPLAQGPGYGGPPPAYVVQAKNPAVSLLVSFFIPGVGSMINGDANTGIIILVSYIISVILMLVLIGFLLAPAVWIWGMIDAYQGAVRWNQQHGVIS